MLVMGIRQTLGEVHSLEQSPNQNFRLMCTPFSGSILVLRHVRSRPVMLLQKLSRYRQWQLWG
jgi:hypothetical protein